MTRFQTSVILVTVWTSFFFDPEFARRRVVTIRSVPLRGRSALTGRQQGTRGIFLLASAVSCDAGPPLTRPLGQRFALADSEGCASFRFAFATRAVAKAHALWPSWQVRALCTELTGRVIFVIDTVCGCAVCVELWVSVCVFILETTCWAFFLRWLCLFVCLGCNLIRSFGVSLGPQSLLCRCYTYV